MTSKRSKKNLFAEWKKKLSPYEKKILNYVFDYWLENNEWPNSLTTAVSFLDDDNEYYETVEKIGSKFISSGYKGESNKKTELTLFGIALCDNSEKLMKKYLDLVQLIIKEYTKNPESRINSITLQEKLNLNEDDLIKLTHIIRNSHRVFSGFSPNQNGPGFELSPSYDILGFRNVETISEYYFASYGNVKPTRFNPDSKKETIRNSLSLIPAHNSFHQIDECFVLIPFNEKFKGVYNLIKKTVEEFEIQCLRADEIFGPSVIIDDIYHYIKKSSFLIADVTGRNPNVFYELGYAHAHQKNVILLTQDSNDVPFDIKHIRYIEYKDNVEGSKDLEMKLRKNIPTFRT